MIHDLCLWSLWGFVVAGHTMRYTCLQQRTHTCHIMVVSRCPGCGFSCPPVPERLIKTSFNFAWSEVVKK